MSTTVNVDMNKISKLAHISLFRLMKAIDGGDPDFQPEDEHLIYVCAVARGIVAGISMVVSDSPSKVVEMLGFEDIVGRSVEEIRAAEVFGRLMRNEG